ncbi:hypothetical protein RND81_08G065300 [Saponaria officinalis]|uniref:Hyccin n=1 Tax=Saponaria officinalis TaxID=3572 RepID=A0AAW1J4A4_SAPOF
MSTSSTSHNSSPPTSPTTPTSTSTSYTTHNHPTTATTTTSSPTKTQAAIESLSTILPSPLSLSSSPSAAFLLTSTDVSTQISTLLRHPSSGSGDNHLCRWLYDTFQSSDPSLQLVILRFIPLISGLYLTRISQRQPLAGFEAVLLALYAHETTLRDGQAISVTIPNMSYPSIYHETNNNINNSTNNNSNSNSTNNSTSSRNNNSTDLDIAVVSSSLEPHGTVRSTRRARIVGVALELFYSKIWVMPVQSKLDFCEFFEIWTGESEKNKVIGKKKLRRIPLPWELLQPCLRILGHCLLGEENININNDNNNDNHGSSRSELNERARSACKSMYIRAMHDVNPKAILAAGSLLKVIKIEDDLGDFDPTEIPSARVISV